MKRTKRIKWLDFAKGITILAVVIVHCISNKQFFQNDLFVRFIKYILPIFIMPLFFSISGFLYKRIRTVKEYALLFYKKVISLLIPYFIFSIIYYVYKSLSNNVSPIDIILGYRLDTPLWFLVSLFMIFLISGLFDLLNIPFKVLFSLSFVILLLSKYFWAYSMNSGIYYAMLYLIYSYSFFFYLGYFIKKYWYKIGPALKSFKLMLVIDLLFMCSLIIQSLITLPEYQNNNISCVNFVTKILGVFACYSWFVKQRQNNFFFKYFDKYGKLTLVIYLIHFTIEQKLNGHLPPNLMGLFALIVITWILSIFICYVSQESKIVNFVFYPRKYINKLIVRTKLGKYLFR